MPDLLDDSDLDLPPEWQDFPADAKYGVLFCAAGWVCHLLLFGVYIFHKYTGEIPQNELLKHLVLAGVINVSEGARRLKLSRNYFQDLCHRLMEVIIEFLRPSKGGRPPMSAVISPTRNAA